MTCPPGLPRRLRGPFLAFCDAFRPQALTLDWKGLAAEFSTRPGLGRPHDLFVACLAEPATGARAFFAVAAEHWRDVGRLDEVRREYELGRWRAELRACLAKDRAARCG